MKTKSLAFILILLSFLFFISTLTISIAQNETNLTVQACAGEDNAAKGSFAGSCDGTYPASCPTDLLSCNDGSVETHTSSTTSNYGGLRVSLYNSSVGDCINITNVEVCYEWWASATTITNCDISVDNDNGASYSAVTTTCPGTTPNPGVTCVNVSALDDWTCNNFFGSTGTRALIKSEFRKSSGGGTRTMSWDVLYFKVNYNTNVGPNITLVFPLNGNITTIKDINFTCNATDDLQLSNITFYWNYSGVWQANGTVAIFGISNQTIFQRNNLNNGAILWNCLACDNMSRCSFAQENWTVVVNYTAPDNPPNITLDFPPVNYYNDTSQYVNLTFNATVTDDYALVNCSLWHNYTGVWHLNQTQIVTGINNVTNFNLYNLTNKIFIWNIQCYDNASQSNFATANRTVILNWTYTNQEPQITLNNPINNTQFNNTQNINFNFTAIDDLNDILNCSIYLDNFLNQTNSTTKNNTLTNFLISGIDYGEHSWYINCSDGELSTISEIRTFRINDTDFPNIYFNLNSDVSGIYNKNWIFINVTCSDLHKDAVILNWNGINESFDYNYGDFYWENKSNLNDGNYTFFAWCNDTFGNLNSTETRNVTIDTTAPIISNVENVSITTNSAIITWNTNELANSSVNYGNTTSLGTYVTNSSFATSHTIKLTNLAYSTTYYYNITSCDILNNCNISGPYNFTTLLEIIYSVNLTDPEDKTTNILNNATYVITITNNGTMVDNYTLSVNNVNDADTLVLNQSSINNLEAGSSINVSLVVGDSTSGNYTTIINIQSDNNASSNYSVSITTQVVSGAVISLTEINPYAVLNGSNITFYISALDADKLWASIIKPDLSQENITLINDNNSTFSNTTLIGKYNVTFYVNDSFGTITSKEDYFETFESILFNTHVVNYNLTGVNTSWAAYYRNKTIAFNNSENGIVLSYLPETILDLIFRAYEDKLQVYLRGINVSKSNNETFGLSKRTSVFDYLVTYGINNSYLNFTNATVIIYYTGLNYTNESFLRLYKCEDWKFISQTCNGIWEDITSMAIQNMDSNYFEYVTTSFSGFSIKDTYNYTTKETSFYTKYEECVYKWNCTEWSECINGKQTRTCKNVGTCSSYYKTPEIERNCSLEIPLIELKLKILEKIIIEGEKLPIEANITAKEIEEKINVLITYQILNSEEEVVFEDKEMREIEKEISFYKDIYTNNLKEGEYRLKVKLEYDSLITFIEDSFKIMRQTTKPSLSSEKINCFFFVLILIILIVSLILLSRKLIKRVNRKNFRVKKQS